MRPTVACASREGIPVILAGRIEKTAAGYRIEVRAVTPGKTEPLSRAEATASDKAQVLGAVGRVAEHIRAALGDTTLGGAQAETFTTVSLEAVRAYTVAQNCRSNTGTLKPWCSTKRRSATTPSSDAPTRGWRRVSSPRPARGRAEIPG